MTISPGNLTLAMHLLLCMFFGLLSISQAKPVRSGKWLYTPGNFGVIMELVQFLYTPGNCGVIMGLVKVLYTSGNYVVFMGIFQGLYIKGNREAFITKNR